MGQRIHAHAYIACTHVRRAASCVRLHTGPGSRGGAFPPDYLSTCTRYCDYASLTYAEDSCRARQHPLVSLNKANAFLITLEEGSQSPIVMLARKIALCFVAHFLILSSLLICLFSLFHFIARFRRLLVTPLSGISRCRHARGIWEALKRRNAECVYIVEFQRFLSSFLSLYLSIYLFIYSSLKFPFFLKKRSFRNVLVQVCSNMVSLEFQALRQIKFRSCAHGKCPRKRYIFGVNRVSRLI